MFKHISDTAVDVHFFFPPFMELFWHVLPEKKKRKNKAILVILRSIFRIRPKDRKQKKKKDDMKDRNDDDNNYHSV